MSIIPELFVLNLNDLTINDFIVLLLTHAEKIDTHPAFQDGTPEYFSKGQALRDTAANLGRLRDASAGGDRNAKAEKMAAWEAGKLAVVMNVQHITMLSLHRKDPGILNNTGLELKQKQQPAKSYTADALDEVPVLTVKHLKSASGPISGAVLVMVTRSRSTVPFELQMTDDPSSEESWSRGNQGIRLKSRIEYRDLESAKRLHFRARYHVDGKTGQWSQVVSIIVL